MVLEAMLLQTPVIGTAELVRYQDTGHRPAIPLWRRSAVGAPPATLYSDADQRRLLARRANKRLRRRFTIENYVAGVKAALAGGHSS